ncbi:hypothetical protein A176_006478 [Myxococcus hansupus]|uniref:Cupin domain-containing protein n=1 Tax=Pseudomyxococcus hansupus TaxID=1297742 RepID=A0A0H4X1N3_9BACT|nr:hypothetical protein [Myxococcus hansupus]AKQ69566.1 hypothetical protein A176_006478 [Myxococcus hansupus]
MRHAPDWARFASKHWEQSPTRLRLGSPLIPPEQAFQGLVSVSAPFRFGTRFRALPDVRFFADTSRLRAPGTLLPGDEDADATAYLQRVGRELGAARSFQCFVEQPLMEDYAQWERVRRFVDGVLMHVGVPVLPIISDVWLGRFSQAPQGAARHEHHSRFTVVLQGRVRVRHWEKDARKARTVEAQAGDVLYAPSHLWQEETSDEGALALRLWIPVRGSEPQEAVKALAVKLLNAQHGEDDTVPYLPYPGKRGPARVPRLDGVASALRDVTHGPDLQQVLRITWAQRVSASALEPVPPPRAHEALEEDAFVRKTHPGRVVRMLDSPGQWLWAVNGHAFAGPGPFAATVLDALSPGVPVRVGALWSLGRGAAQREQVRALLETLHALRGIERVPAQEA